MLALVLRHGQTLTIGESRIVIDRLGETAVKLAVTAPRNLPIRRYDAQGQLLHGETATTTTERPRSPLDPIDWPAAAEQLLAVLSGVAARGTDDPQKAGWRCGAHRPILASVLCRLVFGDQRYRHWDHESRRRRIRDAVVLMRKRLTADRSEVQICADGSGYWLSSDPATLARYAALRRRHAIAELVSAKDIKPNIAAAGGQSQLFNAPTERTPR